MVGQIDARALRHVFGMDRQTPATESFSRFHHDGGFRALPHPTGSFPFRMDLEDILDENRVSHIRQSGKMVFHCVGDTGNFSHGAEAQEAIAEHLTQQRESLQEAEQPLFFYHLGDVVYFDGARTKYEAQFYEPYLHYTAPIVAIAGNHDGAVPSGDTPLQGFMENFCAHQPAHSEMAGASNRTTMTQPNCYWTLRTPFATFIGLYSNVNGQLDRTDRVQEEWLTHELTAAQNDRCVIVAVHHPPYSVDSVHGGHAPIREALDRSFQASGRIPDLVLTAHVHDYQHFERNMRTPGGGNLHYLVAGAGGFAGYSSLHKLRDVATIELPNDVTFVTGNDNLPGFLKIAITNDEIECEYYLVSRGDSPSDTTATVFETINIPLGAGGGAAGGTAPRTTTGGGPRRGTAPPTPTEPPAQARGRRRRR